MGEIITTKIKKDMGIKVISNIIIKTLNITKITEITINNNNNIINTIIETSKGIHNNKKCK
jgi:hypothetical protein